MAQPAVVERPLTTADIARAWKFLRYSLWPVLIALGLIAWKTVDLYGKVEKSVEAVEAMEELTVSVTELRIEVNALRNEIAIERDERRRAD